MNRSEKDTYFLEVIEAHKRIIYKVCYMYATDTEHLKDLYQEVTANIWQGIDSFKGNSAMSTWIYRIALNTCIAYFRRNDRHNHNAHIDNEAMQIAAAGGDSTDAERSLMLSQMYQLIASLGKIDKALIMLWLDEYTYDQIAELTGLSRNNVASRLLRAKKLLVKRSNQ